METNRKIHSKNPSIYINDILKEYKGKEPIFYAIMESQFINKEMIEFLKNDDFNAFIKARTTLLLEQINFLCHNTPTV